MKRFFLVGSPRSGTTLLQSLLAAHPDIHTFPESHFFTNLADTSRWLRVLHMGNKDKAIKRLSTFLSECQEKQLKNLIPYPLIPHYSYFINSFTIILDRITAKHNKTTWVEKTPLHLQFIPQIEQYIPGCRFIHIIRDGYNTINSQVRVSQAHPASWGNRSLDFWINRWKFDIAQSLKYVGNPKHFFIRYEQLAASPDAVMNLLYEFMQLNPATSSGVVESAAYILDSEPWKEESNKGVRKPATNKGSLSEAEIAKIRMSISDVDLNCFSLKI